MSLQNTFEVFFVFLIRNLRFIFSSARLSQSVPSKANPRSGETKKIKKSCHACPRTPFGFDFMSQWKENKRSSTYLCGEAVTQIGLFEVRQRCDLEKEEDF